jgi:hypothetical protein
LQGGSAFAKALARWRVLHATGRLFAVEGFAAVRQWLYVSGFRWIGGPTMCGRFAITLPPEAVRRFFSYIEQPNFPPR